MRKFRSIIATLSFSLLSFATAIAQEDFSRFVDPTIGDISQLLVSTYPTFSLPFVSEGKPKVNKKPNVILILTDDQGSIDQNFQNLKERLSETLLMVGSKHIINYLGHEKSYLFVSFSPDFRVCKPV